MKNLTCPVCGENLQLEAIAELSNVTCPDCGAMIPEEYLNQAEADAKASSAKEEAPPEEAPKVDEEEADELLKAFRDQFERHEINLPKEWVERLQRLATETEVSRRQATVIFVDLRGYTRLTQVLDDVQLDRLRQWFYEICTRRVELYGGFIIQFLGDAAYAAFGAPWAFERDAESAIRALLDIREDVHRRGGYQGHELAIRAGAATGTVNVRLTEESGRPRPDLFGSPVNLAARLEAQAETDEILISDNLAEQVQGIFELEGRQSWTPKNYDREVKPYAVIRYKGDDAVRRRMDIPFFGRQEELKRIGEWIEEASHGGFRAVRLTGEAGIGKTRLMNEAMIHSDLSRLRWAKVECEPHDRHILLGGMIKLLRRIAHWASGYLTPEEMPPEAVFSALAARFHQTETFVLPSIGYILGVEPHASALRSVPVKELRAQVVASLVAMVKSVCRIAPPWVIAVDDAQWCDPLSWEVIDGLAEQRPSGLLLLVSGRKPEDGQELRESASGPDLFAQHTSKATWTELHLPALPESDCIDLVGEILDLKQLHPLLKNRLLNETEGIPLYVIEMARVISEQPDKSLSDILEDQKGETLGISGLIIDVLQARVDKLTRQRRALMQCGAVLGRKFDVKSMRMFETMHMELLEELYALKGLSMLREEPLPEDIAFLFTPTLLRDVTYRMLTLEHRATLHERVALALEKKFAGQQIKAFAYELAFHWTRAGEIGKARPYFRRAAQMAMDKGMAEEAYELICMALDPPRWKELEVKEPTDTPIALQQLGLIHELAGRVCRLLGDYEKSNGHLREVSNIAMKINNPAWRDNAQIQLGINALEGGRAEEAEKMLSDPVFQRPGNEDNYARARNAMGIVKLRTGRLEEALKEFLGLAEDLAVRKTPTLMLGDAWNNAGLVHWHLGNLVASGEAFMKALDVWHKLGNVYGQVSSESNLGIIAEKLGHFSESSFHYDRAVKLAEQIGYIHGISAVEANRANLSILRRSWSDAQKQSARSLHAAELIGHKNSQAIALENLGISLSGMGQSEESFKALEQAEKLGEEMEDPMRRDSAILAAASTAFFNGAIERSIGELRKLNGSLSADLRIWKETLWKGVDAINGDKKSAGELVNSLEDLRKNASVEDYLRRLDVVGFLISRGIVQADGNELLERRAQVFSEPSKAKE